MSEPESDELEEDEWPPPVSRMRAALWRAQGHLERGEYPAAQSALEEIFERGGNGLARGLYHLAAAGYRARSGERERARRQLGHARRRLAPFLADEEIAGLVELVAREVEP